MTSHSQAERESEIDDILRDFIAESYGDIEQRQGSASGNSDCPMCAEERRRRKQLATRRNRELNDDDSGLLMASHDRVCCL